MLKMNNDQLLKKNVKFYFKDLLMVIADEWQCKVNDLQVSNKIGSFIMQKASKKEVLRRAI